VSLYQTGILGVDDSEQTMSFRFFTFPFHVGDAKELVKFFLGERFLGAIEDFCHEGVLGCAVVLPFFSLQEPEAQNAHSNGEGGENQCFDGVLLQPTGVEYEGFREVFVLLPQGIEVALGVFYYGLCGV
jgi:hypothetical protein